MKSIEQWVEDALAELHANEFHRTGPPREVRIEYLLQLASKLNAESGELLAKRLAGEP